MAMTLLRCKAAFKGLALLLALAGLTACEPKPAKPPTPSTGASTSV
jgi:hypothetical protein